jgi:hypothetical protein
VRGIPTVLDNDLLFRFQRIVFSQFHLETEKLKYPINPVNPGAPGQAWSIL